MKNLLLGRLGAWSIDKNLLPLIRESIPLIKDFYEQKGLGTPKPLPVLSLVKEPLKEVFTCPIFSEKFCEIMRDEINHMTFTPNPNEDEFRQIPECILDGEILKSIEKATLAVINPIIWSLWQRTISDIHVQVAKYNPKDKQKGAWHHDTSSNITIVIPLNTGQYKGGGTEFYGRGSIPPLPNGHGVIFPSFTHIHRGLSVEEGDRYLLVFWLSPESVIPIQPKVIPAELSK